MLGKLLITLLIFMSFAMPPAFIWAQPTDPADTEDGDAEDSTGPIEAFPNEVTFQLDADGNPRSKSLNVTLLNNNITRTLSGISFTDLISSNNAGNSISGKEFSTSLPSGSVVLNSGTTTVLPLKYNLTKSYPADKYDGEVILLIEGIEPLTIPIHMVISEKTANPESEPTEISADSIEALPNEVKFELDAGKVSGPLTRNMHLYLKNSNETTTLTNYDVTDMISDTNGSSSITSNAFKLTLSTDLVLNYDPKPLSVPFPPPQRSPAGTYSGHLFLIGEGSRPVNKPIPITIQVNPVPAMPATLGSSPGPILCILAGVAANIIFFLAQEGRRIRAKVTTGIDKAFDSLEQAISDRRMSKDEMIFGIRSFNRGTKTFVEEGDYSEATLEFEQATKYFDTAKSDEDSQINVQIPTREPVYKRMRRSLSLTLAFRRDKLIIIGFAIVLIFAVLTILSTIQEQPNGPVILQFDDPVVDGILAFLLGYSASAVAEQIYPFFGRKEEE